MPQHPFYGFLVSTCSSQMRTRTRGWSDVKMFLVVAAGVWLKVWWSGQCWIDLMLWAYRPSLDHPPWRWTYPPSEGPAYLPRGGLPYALQDVTLLDENYESMTSTGTFISPPENVKLSVPIEHCESEDAKWIVSLKLHKLEWNIIDFLYLVKIVTFWQLKWENLIIE